MTKRVSKSSNDIGTAFNPRVAPLYAALRTVLAQATSLTPHRTKSLHSELTGFSDVLTSSFAKLDAVQEPLSYFDPADPRLFGVFAAIAMIGQPRVPLAQVERDRFYGSGIYALYYNGPYKLYQPISGTEHPIYIGKANPLTRKARTPRQQGTGVCGRLNEHRKNIAKASRSLKLEHFECRYLIVASGWQGPAEEALIWLFSPLWNKETKVIQGFGKHGDYHGTRRHPKSAWDVLHAGRSWATGSAEGQSVAQIGARVRRHLKEHAVVPKLRDVLQALLTHIKTRP